MWKHNNRSVILLIVCLVTYGLSTPINREDLNEILVVLKNEIREEIREEFRLELANEKADFAKKHQGMDFVIKAASISNKTENPFSP